MAAVPAERRVRALAAAAVALALAAGCAGSGYSYHANKDEKLYFKLPDSWTVYDTDQRVFEFKRVAYDIDSAAQKIFGAKLERNFGNRLFIGV